MTRGRALVVSAVLVMTVLNGTGCGTPQVLTVTIEDRPDLVIRLQSVELTRSREGFTHPITLTSQTVASVLSGLLVDIPTVPLPFAADSPGHRFHVFGDGEIRSLAPLLVKGLEKATPEEVVTFYRSSEIDDQFRTITSGAVFAYGDYLYVMVSNYRVKRPIWQDNERYEAPFRLRPLEPIDPQPGRVLFVHRDRMAPEPFDLPFEPPVSSSWIVGVRYRS